jgi:hypothetical protein
VVPIDRSLLGVGTPELEKSSSEESSLGDEGARYDEGDEKDEDSIIIRRLCNCKYL